MAQRDESIVSGRWGRAAKISAGGQEDSETVGFWQEQERPESGVVACSQPALHVVWHRWNGADNEGRHHAALASGALSRSEGVWF